MVLKIPIYVEVPNGMSPMEIKYTVENFQKTFGFVLKKHIPEEDYEKFFSRYLNHLKDFSARVLSNEEVIEHMRKGF